MKLKALTKRVIFIDSGDLDNFINTELDIDFVFESVTEFEWNNREYREVVVEKNPQYVNSPNWKEDVESWLYGSNRQSPYFYGLMNYLCHKNLIPEGNYIVKVSW